MATVRSLGATASNSPSGQHQPLETTARSWRDPHQAAPSPAIDANGAVDEAQAALGLACASVERGSELDVLLVDLERDHYVLMAELATAPANWSKLVGGQTMVTTVTVTRLEVLIDELTERFPPVTEFVIPGHDRGSRLPSMLPGPWCAERSD